MTAKPFPAERLYFRQLLAGRDFAERDPIAGQMVNFVYLIGDRQTRRCLIVDPAYDVARLVAIAQADRMQIEGVLATHYHPDHVGGDLMGNAVQGIRELLEISPVKIHCQRDEQEWIRRVTGVSAGDLVPHDSGDELEVGSIPIQLIHTPGHTPGSQCFLVDGKLVAGDTLFLQGCGRTDFPGGDARQIYLSITQKLGKLPGTTVLFPGHLYDPRPHATLDEIKRDNYVFSFPDVQAWLRQMG